MARTNSTETYVQETSVGNLDVITNFNGLMKASTSKDSLYIRAKESLVEYFASADCILSEREKAQMLIELVSNMAVQMTNSAMSTALATAKEDRDGVYQLTKLRADTLLVQEQADKVAAENLVLGQDELIKKAQADKLVIEGWKLQAGMIREDGLLKDNMPAITSIILPQTSIGDQGLRWEQEQQTKMSVYATLAKSFRESGVISWTTDVEGKVDTITDTAPLTPGLTKAQDNVAIRQKQGFDDNMRQHAANSSANMIGLLLSASESGNITSDDVDRWRGAVNYLNSGGPTLIAGNIAINEPIPNVSKTSGATITGTTTNIAAGTGITMEITDGTYTSTTMIAIVQMDGTWSIDIIADDIDTIPVSSCDISATLQDATGVYRTDTETVSVVA